MSPEGPKPAIEVRDIRQKRAILVVDDDKRVVDLLQISLSQNGYRITTASTGEEALESVRRDTPDLIILDLRLPKKNGYEVCAALKSSKETAAIPVIMVSATAEVDARLQGLMHGADDYLTKPFSPKELLIKVRRIFERMDKQEVLSVKNKELESEVARNREDLVVRNKELRFQVFSLETLMGLTHQLNSSLDLESLMGTVILSVVGQLRVSSACLFLTDAREDPTRLDASTFKGVKEELVRSVSFAYDGGFVRAIRPVDGEEARPVRLQELSEDPSLEREVGPLYAAGFPLVCPVMMKQKLTAVLAVGEKVSGQDFQSTDLDMVKALSESAGIAIENARLFKDLQETYLATVRVLVSTIEAKDPYTRGHTERVAEYAVGIAKAMDFTPEEVQTIQFGAILHDIGKLDTNDSILQKPGALTDEEWRMVKAHPVRGAQMLQGVKFLEKASDLVRHHHERVDGNGYPDGLRGDQITIGAKIVNVADAFDAMTTERPYRAGLTVDQAIGQLETKAGTQFAAEVVEVFVAALRDGRVRVIRNMTPFTGTPHDTAPAGRA